MALTILLTVLVIFCNVLAQEADPGVFTNPLHADSGNDYTDAPVWPIGSTQEITWQNDWQNGTLLALQQNNPQYYILLSSPIRVALSGTTGKLIAPDWAASERSFSWQVDSNGWDYVEMPVWFFTMMSEDPQHPPFKSNYVNLTFVLLASSRHIVY